MTLKSKRLARKLRAYLARGQTDPDELNLLLRLLTIYAKEPPEEKE